MLNLAESCTACPLAAFATHAVWGEGPRGGLMVIGEAPGANEDKTGRPFVGKAGGLLDRLLEEAGLSRREVYITNIVKHRPPGNRDPKPREVEACSDFLSWELMSVAPPVVLLMGRNAMRLAFSFEERIGRVAGTARSTEIHGHQTTAIATWHPASALRNPHQEADIVRDLRRAKRYLGEAS
ncbi:MAG: uracil-DNA glycosylase [Gammaproteobacteria bacterium]